MLQSIRDRASGPLVWFVVGLICIPFAFWGIGTFNFGGGDSLVAKVGDHKITQNEFARAYNQRYQQYRSLMGESFRADLFDEAAFRQLTLEDLIQDSAMRQFARDHGYRVGDQAIRDFLVDIPSFQRDGGFSREAYLDALQRAGMTAESFEAQQRQSLVVDQVRGAVLRSAFVTPEEVAQAHRLQNQLRRIQAVSVTPGTLQEQVDLSESDIAEHYESNKERYRSAERVRLKFVKLDRNEMPESEAPSDEVLKALYEAERESRFATPEERKARHILIPFGEDKSASREKAASIAAQARDGGDFAALAKEHSSDPGSKDKGGDLGWVRKGVMVPEFESALFEMEAGKISEPVESEFGWHVISLDEVRDKTVQAFDDAGVKEELVQMFQARESETRFQELSDKLDAVAFENSALEPVAEASGLEIQTSDWMTRGSGEGIGAVEAVRAAAFSPEVMSGDENSRPIKLDSDSLVVVHLDEHEPARDRPLEEVRSEVEKSLVSIEAARLAGEMAQALVDAVKDGESLESAAKARGLEVQFSGDARRGQAELDASVARAVFELPHPSEAAPTVEAIPGDAPGHVTVVTLLKVLDPESPAMDSIADTERARIREAIAGAEFSSYQEAIEKVVSVERVNAPELQSSGLSY